MRLFEILENNIISLPDAIRKVKEEYNAKGINDFALGNGYCDEFAHAVMKEWKGENWNTDGLDYTVQTSNFIIEDENGEPNNWDWKLLKKHWGISPPSGVSKAKLKEIAKTCPHHVWIAFDKKHYDAESPEGVSSFFDLEFFKRWLRL